LSETGFVMDSPWEDFRNRVFSLYRAAGEND